MSTLWQDLRFSARMLWKSPGFSLVAIFALALGIGANTTIFSAVNALLLRPFAFRDTDRIITVWETAPQVGIEHGSVAPANFLDLKRENTVFEEVAVTSGWSANLTEGDKPERIDECANAVGPNGPGQPGSRADTSGTPEGEATPQAPTQTGGTEPQEEASRREARRQAASNEGGSAGSPERERGGVGELLESLGAPGGGGRPDPGETLRRGLEGAAPTRPGPRPAPQDGGQALLDFLLAP